MLIISKEYKFSASHRLYNIVWSPDKNYEVFGPCTRLHGHNYSFELFVTGDLDYKTGMVFNYHYLDKVAAPILSTMDHQDLNEIMQTDLTTAENIVNWIASMARTFLYENYEGVTLWKVIVKETDKTSAIWQA